MTRLQQMRRARETAALLVMMLALAASGVSAAASGVAPASRTRSFDIRPGQTVSLRESGLRVTLLSVAEDSRCPEGVECVWAGNVRVVLRLAAGSARARRFNLNTATRPPEINYRGRVLKILQVRPPKVEGRRIRPRDYRVKLEVSS